MKIKNVEKFREELYKALKDASGRYLKDSSEYTFAVGRDTASRIETVRKGIPVWDGDECVGLYRPLDIVGTGYVITVDFDADISVWKWTGEYYDFTDFICTNNRKSKMAVAAEAALLIDRLCRTEV